MDFQITNTEVEEFESGVLTLAQGASCDDLGQTYTIHVDAFDHCSPLDGHSDYESVKVVATEAWVDGGQFLR